MSRVSNLKEIMRFDICARTPIEHAHKGHKMRKTVSLSRSRETELYSLIFFRATSCDILFSGPLPSLSIPLAIQWPMVDRENAGAPRKYCGTKLTKKNMVDLKIKANIILCYYLFIIYCLFISSIYCWFSLISK